MEKIDKNLDMFLSEKEDKESYITNQIINYLYYEFHMIDIYSTNDLERIISFANFNKQKVLSLLESYTRDELLKKCDEKDLELLKRSQSEKYADETLKKVPEKKLMYYIRLSQSCSSSSNSNNSNSPEWSFVSRNTQLIDMKDLINNYDDHKLISKAKKFVKDRDMNKLDEYFRKYYESREQKMRQIFQSNLEDNDIKYLHDDELINDQIAKNMKKKYDENCFKGNIKDFYNKFKSSSTFIKIQILDYCDIFSVGKLGLVNRELSEFIYKHYHFEKISKNYCLAIFRNSNLYINQQDKILKEYKNYFTMLKNRPRIYFSGVYYSRVKFTKVGETFGQSDRNIITVFYFRILRFLPNGEVSCLTCPNIKNKKVIQTINKNSVEIKKGRYYIDEDNNIIVEICTDSVHSYIYTYKVRKVKLNK